MIAASKQDTSDLRSVVCRVVVTGKTFTISSGHCNHERFY